MLKPYRYVWPTDDLNQSPHWQPGVGLGTWERELPESTDDLAADSRWPAFFPSPICLVTATDGRQTALEKVVGASIVNRFPYVVALSFCKKPLSHRHHVRETFMDILERGGSVAVQYLPPGKSLDAAMNAVLSVPEIESGSRLERTGLTMRTALTNPSPVFADAYLVYEATLVRPGKDFGGLPIYQNPWVDIGSHRLYFLEITAIQLRTDIAEGRRQIHWRSLPAWTPQREIKHCPPAEDNPILATRYVKDYVPRYVFPSAGTIAFEPDGVENGMSVKRLPPLPEDQVEVDNDRARWPCFFPSSLGLISTWTADGVPNIMPCGSTTLVSRHPLVIAPCVSYAAINDRYAPRTSLDLIRRHGKFGCGVPFLHDAVIATIKYTGNISLALDRNKVSYAGLEVDSHEWSPRLAAVPIHYDCEVVDEVRLGTHIMFLGEVRRIRVRDDVTPANPLEWYPWAAV
jgi:flavin reductase (DIM6/NTAB) family NADH-FMN oxidoreductase RutF